jgi:tetratricopeptide (TPR) repeat protein
LLCIGGPASAAPRAAATAETRMKAKAEFERGRQLYRLTQYREALDAFVEAYKLLEEPAFIYNIAQCRRQLGQDEEAMSAYESYLAIAPANDEARNDVEVFIRDLAVRIAHRHAEDQRARRAAEERALSAESTNVIIAELERRQAARAAPHYSAARARALIVSGSVLGFVGLGLVGGGVGAALSLEDATRALRAQASTQAVFDPAAEQRRDRALTATVSLFAIGGALVAAGAGLFGRGLVERRLVERGKP